MTFLPNYSLLGFETSESHEDFGKEQKEIVESLTKLLPNDVNESGSLRAWAFYDIDESHWPRLINKHKLLQDVEEFGILTPPLLIIKNIYVVNYINFNCLTSITVDGLPQVYPIAHVNLFLFP